MGQELKVFWKLMNIFFFLINKNNLLWKEWNMFSLVENLAFKMHVSQKYFLHFQSG